MVSPAQNDLAFVQQIKKEKWHPTQINQEFQDTLDIAMLHEKYGIKEHRPADTLRLSKFDLNKLIEKQRRQQEIKEEQKELLNEIAEPIDSKSTLIWKDRSFKKNEKIKNENQLVGRIGNIAFDNEIQKTMEERFLKNLEARKRHVLDNALRAQAILNLNSSIYNTKTETESSVTSRLGIDRLMLNKTGYVKKPSQSITPAKQQIGEIISDAKREQRDSTSLVSGGKHEPSEIRRRMLQIRGQKELATPKERFNENNKEETASIRQQLHNKLTLTETQMRGGGETFSGSIAGQSLASSRITGVKSIPKSVVSKALSRARDSIKFIQGLDRTSNVKQVTQGDDQKFDAIGEHLHFQNSTLQKQNNAAGDSLKQSIEKMETSVIDDVKKTVKTEHDALTSITYMTEASSLARNPVSVQLSGTSSKLELQLDFLARELELEKLRREKLQDQVVTLAQIIEQQQHFSQKEIANVNLDRFLREQMKPLDTNMTIGKNIAKGFVDFK